MGAIYAPDVSNSEVLRAFASDQSLPSFQLRVFIMRCLGTVSDPKLGDELGS